MRRIHAGLWTLALIVMLSPALADEGRGEPAGAGIAGTYWVSIQDVSPAAIPAILAFTADGRIVGVEGQGPETAALGTWENEGNSAVVGSFLWFLGLDLAQVIGIDGAAYQYIARVDFSGTFDAKRTTATLPFTLSVFSIAQNPLVDDALLSLPGEMVATRLRVRAP